jgi:hypothetical protein
MASATATMSAATPMASAAGRRQWPLTSRAWATATAGINIAAANHAARDCAYSRHASSSKPATTRPATKATRPRRTRDIAYIDSNSKPIAAYSPTAFSA